METTTGHKDWLKRKLRQYKISEEYISALAIVVGRTVYTEQLRMHRYDARAPYYMVHDKEGKPTKGWQFMAELALFCKYREYRPAEYVRALCSIPRIRRKLYFDKYQLSLNYLSPSTRISATQLHKLESHFLKVRSLTVKAYGEA